MVWKWHTIYALAFGGVTNFGIDGRSQIDYVEWPTTFAFQLLWYFLELGPVILYSPIV